MKYSFSTITEQVAQALKDGIREGRWKESMPGRLKLADELGVNHKTVKAALAILEKDGLLETRGAGRERRIVQDVPQEALPLRVKILAHDKNDFKSHYLLEIIHRLHSAGHQAEFAPKTLRDLSMDLNRVTRMVEKIDADAWLVLAGPKDILEWFHERAEPAFAIFGRSAEIPMASTHPRKSEAFFELLDNLVSLGHKRIVMLTHEDRRKPVPGGFERAYLKRLEDHGIRTSGYNLPDWGSEPDELRDYINSSFKFTPPTAMIIDDSELYPAVVQNLASLGITAPRDISLACMDGAMAFKWCRPKITHISFKEAPMINSVVNWVRQVSRGKHSTRKTVTSADLIRGDTIGPAPKQ